MPYIGTDINYGNLAKQTGTGDGADTTPIAALTYTVPSSESILVFLDGVCQVPSTDFTATGTTLTFTTAPANGVAILVMFLGRSLDIGTPADNTVGLAQLAGGTDGNLITYDASGDPANVATGTATHVLTSNGAGAAPTFQAASGSGWKWIETITASGSASADIEGFSSTNSNYMITGEGIHLANAEWIKMEVKRGDAYVAGSDYARTGIGRNTGDTAHTIVTSNTAATSNYVIAQNMMNNVGDGGMFEVLLFDTQNTASTHPFWMSRHVGAESGSSQLEMHMGFGRLTASTDPVQGVRISAGSGNITLGNFNLYGLLTV